MTQDTSKPASPLAVPANAAAGAMQIGIGPQYIKDLSFESPNVPQVFAPTQKAPEITLGVNVHTRPLKDAILKDPQGGAPQGAANEVLLSLKLEAKLEGKTAFIAELAYGGVFMFSPMPEEQMRALLLVECPRILFPFARQVLMNAVRDGGFPQVAINPIDFGALYLANKNNIGSMPAVGAA
jgi:preprotein translocase subunit SecB